MINMTEAKLSVICELGQYPLLWYLDSVLQYQFVFVAVSTTLKKHTILYFNLYNLIIRNKVRITPSMLSIKAGGRGV